MIDLGVQCVNRVLLGSISSGIEFRWYYNDRSKQEGTKSWFSSETCQILGRSWYLGVQFICMVVECSQSQVTVRSQSQD